MNRLDAVWPCPKNVFAFSTLRKHGASRPPYDENNLALHVGDQCADVTQNRHQLVRENGLPNEPQWLNQTHSTRCVKVELDSNRDADAAVTTTPNTVLAILTADCLPIVICNRDGSEVAAVHAGWRGLANGIIAATLEKMQSPRETLMAWIGPSICGHCYETQDEVKDAFLSKMPHALDAFKPHNGRVLSNLPMLAEIILKKLGLKELYQSNQCTYESQNKDRYFSYRREPQTGRIATLIWFTPHKH